MTTIAPEPGLRERKRQATRRAIQMAVIDLVAERGLEGTTVDEISRVADVSPRTFFNYFASKEDAIIGDLPALPDPEYIEGFVAAGGSEPLLESLAEFIVETIGIETQDQELMQRRKDVLHQYPQLFAIRLGRMRKIEEELAGIIALRLQAGAGEPEESVASRARLISYVSFATMRHAWSCWASGEPNSKLPDRVRESFSELTSILSSEARANLG
jgi:AcrR family transcriptional regulator